MNEQELRTLQVKVIEQELEIARLKYEIAQAKRNLALLDMWSEEEIREFPRSKYLSDYDSQIEYQERSEKELRAAQRGFAEMKQKLKGQAK